jgi:hypothetical protein
MNNKLLIALSFSLLAAACAQQEHNSQDMQSLILNCEIPPEVPCIDANPKNKVTINTAAAKLKAVPMTVCAKAGEDIEVTIKPETSTVFVVTVPKDSENGWMLASNAADPLSMTISVPGSTDDGLYEYLIITGNGKCLDPRIHVK